MKPPNNNCSLWPPSFSLPPAPIPFVPLINNELRSHDFILQCINKQKEQVLHIIDENDNPSSPCSSLSSNICALQNPLKKRARLDYTRRNRNGTSYIPGILRNCITPSRPLDTFAPEIMQDATDNFWLNITTQNNNLNFEAQEKWRGYLAIPIELSMQNRASLCSRINGSWVSRYGQEQIIPTTAMKSSAAKTIQICLPQQISHIDGTSAVASSPVSFFNDSTFGTVRSTKRSRSCSVNGISKLDSTSSILTDIKTNLRSRADSKITRIATWNINNGFDHLAIASIMAKQDIDILTLQEPRVSHSTKDDVWISTMRKELRRCKYELITSQFSYIVFDEQTSGAALASILRQASRINGRLLSATFKTNDVWEAHTIISLYAVTNAQSKKKYAKSHKSRHDVNAKLTKALDNEITYLLKTFGDAPITIVGDYQDTIHADKRDNIGIVGRKILLNGPLQLLLNLGFQSAYHKMHPNSQQVTRWNSSRTAGRHIDLQMLNDSAASLLTFVKIDDADARNHISSDHLIVIADYAIEKAQQNIIDAHRTKINFRKIAGIKMKCTRKITRCTITSSELSDYHVSFDESQFLSCMVQDERKMLENWQHEGNSDTMQDILSKLEASMLQLETATLLEDCNLNECYDSATSNAQRKLVERNLSRRAQLDSIYNKFQSAIYQLASSVKIISTENKHVDALCTRQVMKSEKVKRYGDKIINLSAPTSKLRSAMGDLKNAEATLRNIQHSISGSANNLIDRHQTVQQSLRSLSRNAASFDTFINAFSLISRTQEEHINRENAVSNHRKLDPFSGRWNECRFSSDICKNLISQTNQILKETDVKQHVGMKQLDQSAIDDDHWSNLQHLWNGPDLVTLASSPDMDINTPAIADAIQNALESTRKLKKQAMSVLISKKEKGLTHDSRLNHTRMISKKLNPKVMEEPEAHHVILDPTNIHAPSNIRCNNFTECLDNTLLYHQNWMDRSGSKWEHHWFKTTSKFGHIDGIRFNFAGKPTDAEFEGLVKQHQNCPDHIRKAFQDAHSDEIANVMQPPQYLHRALDWPWHPSSTAANWDSFTNNYWKAVTSVPRKARYNGYTMAVIGRLPRRWIHLHIRVMKMMLILRILPEKTKIQARVPIPKPKPGETRPLSLIHDDMCFILGLLTKHFKFPPTIRAYRQGMSTSFITLIDLAVREDALSFGRYMALTAEDEEKFFDRVSLEVQLAVLSILGFPLEGFLEMKAKERNNISVEIHTRHGQVIGKFLHGLKQGSPLSCLISNLVLIFKHRIWGIRDPTAKIDDPNGYSMTTWNKIIDGEASPLVSMEGFCDDNSKWNMGNGCDFSSMVQAIKWNLKLAGDLSMIFKVGRRGDKTIIELFNVDLQDIHLLPEHGFTSIAWDFKANRPTEEEVDCRVYLKSGLSLPSSQPDSISDPIWNMLVKGASLKSERRLGIWRNKFGDTTESADKRAFLFGLKIDRLNLSNIKNDKTIKIAINSLVVPVYQFGILENQCCPLVYDKMDVILINKIRQAMGFAWCDAKQLMFVSETHFGMGIRSVSVEMLKSISRELEVQLNDKDLIGKILRGRLEAFKNASFHHAGKSSIAPYDHINKGIRNLIVEAIRYIAHYGLYIRDMTDLKTSFQIESAIILAQTGTLFKNFQQQTLGMNAFAGTGSRPGTTLGPGDGKLLWSSLYGRGHTLLNGTASHSNVKLNFSEDQIQHIKSKASQMLQDDIQALYTIFEWSDHHLTQSCPELMASLASLADHQNSINNSKHWRRLSALSSLKAFSPEDVITEADNLCFLDDLWTLTRGELLSRIESQYTQPNRLAASDIQFLLADGWPLIIATDGGADKFAVTSLQPLQCRASAGVVILRPPAMSLQHFLNATAQEQQVILSQNCLPWRARASSLPTQIGDQNMDSTKHTGASHHGFGS